jgi:hypothetical protein
MRRTPLFDWRGYVDERLGVGYTQYEASLQLSRLGDKRVACAAAAEGFATAPTMYLHPKRFTHLMKHLPLGRARRSDSPAPDHYRESCSRRT